MKLVVREPETGALLEHLATDREHCSSSLASVEVLRAVSRLQDKTHLSAPARQVLGRIALIRLDQPVLSLAADLSPASLRPLDAIHLATVLTIADPVPTVVTYDQRLHAACLEADVPAVSPR